MIKWLLALTVVFAVSCTKKAAEDTGPVPPTPPAPATEIQAPTPPPAPAETMPMFNVDAADQACSKDSDCERVANTCSCSCGQSVNKNSLQKYAGKLEEICKDYHGKECKMDCNGKSKCINKQCVYTF